MKKEIYICDKCKKTLEVAKKDVSFSELHDNGKINVVGVVQYQDKHNDIAFCDECLYDLLCTAVRELKEKM